MLWNTHLPTGIPVMETCFQAASTASHLSRQNVEEKWALDSSMFFSHVMVFERCYIHLGKITRFPICVRSWANYYWASFYLLILKRDHAHLIGIWWEQTDMKSTQVGPLSRPGPTRPACTPGWLSWFIFQKGLSSLLKQRQQTAAQRAPFCVGWTPERKSRLPPNCPPAFGTTLCWPYHSVGRCLYMAIF